MPTTTRKRGKEGGIGGGIRRGVMKKAILTPREKNRWEGRSPWGYTQVPKTAGDLVVGNG